MAKCSWRRTALTGSRQRLADRETPPPRHRHPRLVYYWLKLASDREGMLVNYEPAEDEAAAA